MTIAGVLPDPFASLGFVRCTYICVAFNSARLDGALGERFRHYPVTGICQWDNSPESTALHAAENLECEHFLLSCLRSDDFIKLARKSWARKEV
jgi:hypothetical protein